MADKPPSLQLDVGWQACCRPLVHAPAAHHSAQRACWSRGRRVCPAQRGGPCDCEQREVAPTEPHTAPHPAGAEAEVKRRRGLLPHCTRVQLEGREARVLGNNHNAMQGQLGGLIEHNV